MSNGDGGDAGGKKRGGKSRSRGRGRKKKVDLHKFWGDAESLPHPSGYDPSTPDTTAVVSSLGRVPIPGQEAAAAHFFQLVYSRAAGLATALAAAGGLEEIGGAGSEHAVGPDPEGAVQPAGDDEAVDGVDPGVDAKPDREPADAHVDRSDHDQDRREVA